MILRGPRHLYRRLHVLSVRLEEIEGELEERRDRSGVLLAIGAAVAWVNRAKREVRAHIRDDIAETIENGRKHRHDAI